MSAAIRIERLAWPAPESDVRALAVLLVDAVESVAGVSFVAPLSLESAEDWWRQALSGAPPRAIFLVARQDTDVVGTVQLQPAWAPNQPHRAEVAKLLVHRRARRAGIGLRLMGALEDEARRAGFRLLTLDTKRGGPAERLYRKAGWTGVGTIPGFGVDSDGALHDAALFYKTLEPAG